MAARLDEAIGTFTKLVRDAADRSRADFGLRLEVILEDVDQRFDRAGLPRHEQRIDAIGLGVRRQHADALDRFFFAVQSAVRVNHELRHGAGRLLRKPLARRVDNDFSRVRLRIDADAERHIGNIEHTIIAADERMQIGLGGAPRLVRRILKGMVDRPWVVARIRGILRRLGLRSQRLTRGHAKAGERDPLVRHLHRNAEGADPCVGAMFDPILVRQHAEAARAPELAP